MPHSKAVIWDMDGVIVDTAPYHFRSWYEVFKRRGVNFTEKDFRLRFGQRNDFIIQATLGNVPSEEMEAIALDKETIFRNLMRDRVRALPGAVELIKSLAEHGFRNALASSAPPGNIKLLIGSLGLNDYFDVIVSGHEVAESKPSPQVFLLAARRLGVRQENCIVIEDAITGVAAAKRAGMHCVAVTTTNSRAKLAEADLVVYSLGEVTIDALDKLIRGVKMDGVTDN